MKNIITLFTLLILFCTKAFAANTVGTVSAKIVPVIDVSVSSDLSFGFVDISPESENIGQDEMLAGDMKLMEDGNMEPAIFDISGLDNVSYNFVIPVKVTLTDSNSNSITANLSLEANKNSRSLDNSGKDSVIVNGTLLVSSNQSIGHYSGTYNVNIYY